MGSCLTDVTREAAPGVPFVCCRYAEARTTATTVDAAMTLGGPIQFLILSSNLQFHFSSNRENRIDQSQVPEFME